MRNNNQQKLFDAVPIKDIEGRGQRVLLKDIPAPYREEFSNLWSVALMKS